MTERIEMNNETTSESSERVWTCCNEDVPSNEMVFFSQVIIVYIVIITCIINLSLQNDPRDLWVALLSSCLGYILPSPALDRVVKQSSA